VRKKWNHHNHNNRKTLRIKKGWIIHTTRYKVLFMPLVKVIGAVVVSSILVAIVPKAESNTIWSWFDVREEHYCSNRVEHGVWKRFWLFVGSPRETNWKFGLTQNAHNCLIPFTHSQVAHFTHHVHNERINQVLVVWVCTLIF